MLPTPEELPSPKGVKVLKGIDDDTVVEAKHDERTAATQAAPFEWKGRKLHPLAIDREGDWMMMRAALGRPPLGLVVADPLAFLIDAIAIIWFCSMEPKDWLGRTYPQIDADMRQWAADNIEPGEQEQIINLALNIFNRAHSTQAAIKPSSKSPGKRKQQPRRRQSNT